MTEYTFKFRVHGDLSITGDGHTRAETLDEATDLATQGVAKQLSVEPEKVNITRIYKTRK